MYLPKPSEGNFAPPPAGTHVAVCYRIIDLGTQQGSYKGEVKFNHKIMLTWELSNELMEDDKPFTISKRYTLSTHEKAVLRKDLEAWRGLPFEDSDFGEGGFNMKKLLGVPCMIGINHIVKDGKTYANLSSILKLPKGMGVPTPINSPVYLSLEPTEFKQEVFDNLSESLRTTISESPEYRQLFNTSSGVTIDRLPPASVPGEEVHFS